MAGQSPMAADADVVRDQPIDLARLFKALARRKWWILAPTLATFAGALLFVETTAPRYTGVAKVLLENQESYFTRPEKAVNDPGPTFDPEAVQSEAETVATGEVARKAIDKLGLAADPEFSGASAGVFGLLSSWLGGGDRREAGVDAFLSRLTAFPIPRSRVLQIEFVSRDPALAARGANTVAEIFLQRRQEAKVNAAKTASAPLAKTIDELRVKVAEADDKVEAFRAQSGLLAGANGVTMSAQQLADLNTQLASARAAQSAALAKAQLIRRMLREGRLGEVQDVAKDDSLRRYSEQRVALKAAMAESARTLLPEHPRMKELNAQLAELDQQIRAAAGKAARSLETDANLAGAQVETVNAALGRQSKTVASGNADEVRLRALELEAKTAREQLESYMQRHREATARAADAAAPADARIVAFADAPRSPTFPKKAPTVLLASLAALLIATAIASAAALSTDGGQAESAKAPPVALNSPKGEKEALAEPGEAEEGPPAQGEIFGATDALAQFLASARGGDGGLTVLCAGDRSASALATALETSRRLAGQGTAVLVDLGETQDWFADVLDRDDDPGEKVEGLSDLVDGRASIDAVLRRDLSSRLDILPAGERTADPEALEDIVAALASSYDWVVLHASDWRSPAARAGFSSAMAGVIVAPAARLEAALTAVQAELGQSAPAILGFIAPAAPRRIEKAA